MSERELTGKREALGRILELAETRFDREILDAAATAAAKVDERLRHGTAHTVVALAGPTGSGKSSIFNALIGEEVSTASVRRPTTGTTHAAIFGTEEAGALLDWLQVTRRHLATTGEAAHEGLVLLDLPDHDSTAVDHQLEVDRLVELVDVLVWITEPQKYADHVMHDRYVRPLAGYGEVMVFVVSKIDLLSETDRTALVDDYRARLADDGIANARVVTVTTTTDDGLIEFRTLLAQEVAAKAAAVARLEADLEHAAGWFRSVGADRSEVSSDISKALHEQLAVAAGADKAGDAVARQHERNGALATGWPATRWLRRFRRQPFGDVPIAIGNSAAEAKADLALRDATTAVGEDLGAPWPHALRDAVAVNRDQVVAALGRVTTAEARQTLSRPGWWAGAAWLQRIFALIAVAGGGWLLAMAVMGGFLALDTEPLTLYVPEADWLPVPTAMLLGGILAGLITAFICRLVNGVGGRRRSLQVHKAIEQAVAVVADEHVIEPMNSVLAERNELAALVTLLND